MSWKLSATGSKGEIEAALERRETTIGWDENIVLSGFEIDPDQPDTWQLDAYLEGKPTEVERKAVRALFDSRIPRLKTEELPETDWVVESQKGVDPVSEGRFYVRTPDHAAPDGPDVVDFVIPAAQAFGTGQHETTSGCLAMLEAMKAQGVVARNIADIGTGTGLLAFAAMELWPRARTIASDIDPVCEDAVIGNALANRIPLGTGRGDLAFTVAGGLDDPLLAGRAPYDLIIANILAGPLIELAPDFGAALAPRGNVLLSGLLTTQKKAVCAAYRRAGLRLQASLVRGDWSILWLRQRYRG